MKLLLRRDQKSGIISSSITFMLEVRAELTDEERGYVRKYKLGRTMLYEKFELQGGSGLLGAATRLAWKAVNLTISIDDLVGGKRVECKDILEMIAVEEQIREAFKNFKQVLEAAARFGGEEVVEA